jgi:hypothetical protein
LLAGLVADAPNIQTETASAQSEKTPERHQPGMVTRSQADAPICQCGTLMVRAGACFSCPNCFATTGVCN